MREESVFEIRARVSATGYRDARDVMAVLADAARQAGWELEDVDSRPLGPEGTTSRGWTGVHAGLRIGERRHERDQDRAGT